MAGRLTAAEQKKKDIDAAVEAALKVYKSRVANQVTHYKDTGDLCEEEAANIRRELELEEYLPAEMKLTLDLRGNLITKFEGEGVSDDGVVAEAIGNALCKVLKEGVKIDGSTFKRGILHQYKGTVKMEDPDLYEATLEVDD